MSAGKREPVYHDGIAIDPDWLDAQVANYKPGCMDEAIRLMRLYEDADLRRAAGQAAQRGTNPIPRVLSADIPAGATVDIRPISLDIDRAMDYTGLSRTSLNALARQEKVAVRKEGTKNLYMRESLDRYILSLPARGAA